MDPKARLFTSIADGDDATVRELLDQDASLAHARSSEGVPALLVARYNGQMEIFSMLLEAAGALDIFEAAAAGRAERVDDLLAAEPGLTREYTADGWTLLHLAAFWGHLAVARTLLEAGTDPGAIGRNALSNTALHAAAAGRHHELCRLLLEQGADPDAKQHGGYTALQSAALHGDEALLELLLEHNAQPSIVSDEGETAETFALKGGYEKIAQRLRDTI